MYAPRINLSTSAAGSYVRTLAMRPLAYLEALTFFRNGMSRADIRSQT